MMEPLDEFLNAAEKQSPEKMPAAVEQVLGNFTERLAEQLEQQFTKLADTVKQDVRQQSNQAMLQLEKRLEKVEGRVSPSPVPHGETPSSLDNSKNDEAVSLYYRGEWEAAAQLLEACCEQQPDHVAVWNNLGAVYTAMGKHEEAIKAYTRAAELAPDQVELLNNRGVLNLMQGDVDAALRLFHQAQETNPDQMAVLLNLAEAYQALGHYTRAVQAWKMVVAIDPAHEEANRQLRQFYQ